MTTAADESHPTRPSFCVLDLKVDDRSKPLGTSLTAPRFSWRLESNARDCVQAAYRLMVAAGEAKLWDSGVVRSRRSVHVPYAGPPLQARTRYEWDVEVAVENSAVPATNSSFWETGIATEDWVGEWITYVVPDQVTEPPLPSGSPSPHLRTTFELSAKPRRARLYATALGLYEARINGRRVGNQHLAPGWTDYNRRVLVQTYDVTQLLVQGENVLAAILADGWYAGHVGFFGRSQYGDHPACLMQLEVELETGPAVLIATDRHWRGSTGPIRQADIIMGEAVDLTLVEPGWDEPGFDDSHWAPVQRRAGTGAELVPQRGGEIKVVEEIAPQSITRNGDVFIADFGQNFAGRVRMTTDRTSGTITMRHGEMLDANGALYTANLGTAAQRDEFIIGGDQPRTLQTTFSYHGFRYAEVRGVPHLAPEAIRAEALSSATRRTGTFRCSNPILNQLQENIVWSQLSNFMSVPTDCPQRDERLGWTGDALAFVGTATFNFDVLAFFRKWLDDLDDAQLRSGAYPDIAPTATWTGSGNAGWAEVGVLLPWLLYQRYGDERVLEERYEQMRRFATFLETDSTGYIRDGGRYGDWVSLGEHTAKDLIGTAYVAATAKTMAAIAGTLDHEDDAQHYTQLYGRVRQAFQERFIDADGSVGSGTQTAYLLALAWNLVPEDIRQLAVKRLVAGIDETGHLTTGFLGTPIALPVLSDNGEHEVACRLAERVDFPSWGFSVVHGATTLWERWDAWTRDGGFHEASMNSFNHYAFGAVGDWMYRYIGGLTVADDGPGYARAVVQPRPGGSLTEASLRFESVHGRYEIEWKLTSDTFELAATVPANAQADVVLPFPDRTGRRLHGVGSGTHRFVTPVSPNSTGSADAAVEAAQALDQR